MIAITIVYNSIQCNVTIGRKRPRGSNIICIYAHRGNVKETTIKEKMLRTIIIRSFSTVFGGSFKDRFNNII